jgi:hypothetical protein
LFLLFELFWQTVFVGNKVRTFYCVVVRNWFEI